MFSPVRRTNSSSRRLDWVRIERTRMPAALSAANTPLRSSLRGITMAKRKKVKVLKPGDLGVRSGGTETDEGVSRPPERAAGQIVATPEELVHKLTKEAKVI